jgi:hypothetical protein
VLPAADELDDFEGVVGLDVGRLPSGSGENFAVAFDGDALGAHLQNVEEGGDGQAIGDFAAISIDDDLHARALSSKAIRAPILSFDSCNFNESDIHVSF